jgi:hypothetical protein
MLKDSGLDFFHMTDFESFKGPYKNWTRTRHEAVIKRIVRDINGTASYFVGFSVLLDHYDALAPEAKSFVGGGSPYRFGAEWCMGSVAKWLEEQGVAESVDYIFESGDKHQFPLREAVLVVSQSPTAIETLRIHSLNFEAKKKTLALQAADVLAFETSKQTLRNIGAESRPVRKSLYALLEAGLPHESVLFDSAALDRWINQPLRAEVEVLLRKIKSELP